MKPVSTNRGFSLSELLVVVAVILVLLAILVVGIDKVYSHAMQVKCAHRLEQIGHAMQMYSARYHGLVPPAWDAQSGLLWYEFLAATALDDTQVLACPVVGEPPVVGERGSITNTRRQYVEPFAKALYWLKDTQQLNGKFPAVNAYQLCYAHDTATTAFALMAFFGFGCNDRRPPQFAATVRKGVEFLCRESQYDDGRFGRGDNPWSQGRQIAKQGVCLMALAAAYRMVEDPALRSEVRQAAERGLQWLADNTPYHGGYGYNGPVPDGDTARTSHSTWAYQAIGAARIAGLQVPSGFTAPMQFLLDLNAASNGRMSKRWDPEGAGTYGGWQDWSRYGFGLVMRLCLGDSPGSSIVQQQTGYVDPYLSGFAEGQLRYRYYHVTRGLRMAGGPVWDKWRNPSDNGGSWQGYPAYVLMHLIDDGEDGEGNPMAHWSRNLVSGTGGNSQVGDSYVTGLSLCMLADTFDENWWDESFRPFSAGSCSYGYNNRLGKDRRTPAADTILVMDYEHWEIDHDDVDVESNDDLSKVALRHDGRANALMGDGSVRTFRPDEIQPGNWTPRAGD